MTCWAEAVDQDVGGIPVASGAAAVGADVVAAVDTDQPHR